MEYYILGVDGGGTKSHLALFSSDGALVRLQVWGPLNHESLPGSYGELETGLGAAVNRTLDASGVEITQLAHTVFGLAGVDTARQREIISGMAERLGFASFTMCNDAFLGIPANSPDCTGICAINGTGCTLAAIDRSGARMQVGGIGEFSHDLGGGGFMGARAVGAAYCHLFRSGPATAITGMLLDRLGLTDGNGFADALTSALDSGMRIDDCNRFIFKAAEAGDTVALSLLREIASNYAGGIAHIIHKMDFPKEQPVTVTLAGSVFVKEKSPLLTDMLREELDKYNTGKNVVFSKLEAPPVAGAVVWALEKAGRRGMRESVCRQLIVKEPSV